MFTILIFILANLLVWLVIIRARPVSLLPTLQIYIKLGPLLIETNQMQTAPGQFVFVYSALRFELYRLNFTISLHTTARELAMRLIEREKGNGG